MNWVTRGNSEPAPSNSLQFLYSDYEQQGLFYMRRKKEIEELIVLFQDRIDAESIYSQRLQRIAEHRNQALTIGKLGEEVQSYKQNCLSKARQAQELADNMEQDCVATLRDLLKVQEENFQSRKLEGRLLISNLQEFDLTLKQNAAQFFRAAKEAEEMLIKYEQVKYSVDMTMAQKQLCHEQMIQSLKNVREKESKYKESVDNSNSHLVDFRVRIEELVNSMEEFEKERCEAVHSAINKFVVYEKFSEMNNKYDVNNFSKILEEYNNEDELNTIREHLASGGQISKNNIPKYEFVPFQSKYFNLNNIKSEDLAPPREKLSHYTNSNDVLKFLIGRILTEMPLHEEYYLQLNNIFQTNEGRNLFIQQFNKRFNTSNKFFMGKASFKNLQEQVDQFLHQCFQKQDYTNAINLMPFLETFHLRGQVEGGEQNPSLKSKVKSHCIWNTNQLWEEILGQKLGKCGLENKKQNEEQFSQYQQEQNTQEESQEEVKKSESEMNEQQSQEQSEVENQKFQLLMVFKELLDQMITFEIPSKVIQEVKDNFYKEYGISFGENPYNVSELSQLYTQINEIVEDHEKKQDEVLKTEMENKKKGSQQPAKGIPDWISDLWDPMESRSVSRLQNKPKPFLSLKELIGGQKRPSSPYQSRPNPSNWAQPQSKVLTDSHETEETTTENP